MTENETPSQPDLNATPERRTCRRPTSCGLRTLLVFVLFGVIVGAVLLFGPWHAPAPVASSEEIDQLKKRIDNLENRLDGVPANAIAAPQAGGGDSEALNDSIRNLEARLAQIEKQKDQSAQSAQKILSEYFAFQDLREQAQSGQAFTQQLATFHHIAGDHAALIQQSTKLEPYAAEGASTYMQLRETLTREEQKSSLATENGDADSWRARLKSALQSLISVRPLHDVRFVALEKAVEAQDGNTALTAWKELPLETQQVLAPWQQKLEARMAVDDALRSLATSFTSSDPGNAP